MEVRVAGGPGRIAGGPGRAAGEDMTRKEVAVEVGHLLEAGAASAPRAELGKPVGRAEAPYIPLRHVPPPRGRVVPVRRQSPAA